MIYSVEASVPSFLSQRLSEFHIGYKMSVYIRNVGPDIGMGVRQDISINILGGLGGEGTRLGEDEATIEKENERYVRKYPS